MCGAIVIRPRTVAAIKAASARTSSEGRNVPSTDASPNDRFALIDQDVKKSRCRRRVLSHDASEVVNLGPAAAGVGRVGAHDVAHARQRGLLMCPPDQSPEHVIVASVSQSVFISEKCRHVIRAHTIGPRDLVKRWFAEP